MKPLRPRTPFGDPRCAYIRFDGERCPRRDAGAAGFCAAHVGGTASAADKEALAALEDGAAALARAGGRHECGGSGLVACHCAICALLGTRACPCLGRVQCRCRKPLSSSAFHELIQEEK